MGLRKKFFILAGLAGLLMAIVSIVGYLSAYSNLEESVENELTATVNAQQNQLDGWLNSSAAIATGAANLMTALNGNDSVANLAEMLSFADNNSVTRSCAACQIARCEFSSTVIAPRKPLNAIKISSLKNLFENVLS